MVLRADGGEGASLAGAGKSRARYAQRDGRLLEERLPVIVCLTWAKRAGNTYRVSFRCRNADAIAMNSPRRLCGTMPPTHVSHPPTSFMSMWFSRTSDLRISAAKSPSRHRLHILKHVRVCPREHACGIRPGARQAHVFKLCTWTLAQICMGPCARFLLCAVAAQKRGFFVRFPTGLGAQALKARSLTSAIGGFCAHCRYCNLALSGMHYIVKAV